MQAYLSHFTVWASPKFLSQNSALASMSSISCSIIELHLESDLFGLLYSLGLVVLLFRTGFLVSLSLGERGGTTKEDRVAI